jgi:hypothetical protein
MIAIKTAQIVHFDKSMYPDLSASQLLSFTVLALFTIKAPVAQLAYFSAYCTATSQAKDLLRESNHLISAVGWLPSCCCDTLAGRPTNELRLLYA